jgi:integrase
MAMWRDKRLGEVSPSSVAREMNLWGALFSIAVREWHWLNQNPMRGIKRPVEPPARRRGVSGDEVAAIIKYCVGPGGQSVAAAFLLSLETAMRAGEILGLTWDHVDLQNRVVTLPVTKNGDSRQVPLSTNAVNILSGLAPQRAMEPRPADKRGPMVGGVVFTITGATLDVLFRRARDKAIADCPSCKTVRFHDARSEAITRLSRKLDVLELARVVGHRQLSSLLHYYRATAADLAKKLD